MISVTYKLTADVIARAANLLNWNLKTVNSSVDIINAEGRKVNGKSLVGLLSGKLRKNDEIKVIVDHIEDLPIVKSYFNEVGKEIKQKG